MKEKVWFERAIFLSWYCSRGDCKFCFMSTQKDRIRDPRKAIKHPLSVYVEAFICRLLDWKIEFLSGGYESYTTEELLELIKNVYKIYGNKVWLNIGVLTEKEMRIFAPYIKGVCGACECMVPTLHDYLCPSKPISEIENMFDSALKLGLKRSMTMIVGLGEKLTDFKYLRDFIKKHDVDKITFYALNPHEGTMFTKGPEKDYYSEWIKKTRETFPALSICAGSWHDRFDEVHLLLESGADNITKFKAWKLFGTEYSKQLVGEVEKAGKIMMSEMNNFPYESVDPLLNEIDIEERLKKRIRIKLDSYIKNIR